jgi:hypothetical protein
MSHALIVGILVLPAFLGFTVVGYGRTITVSQAGSADYRSISAAYNDMVIQTKGTLRENWTIKVLDTSVYQESVYVNDLKTSKGAQLTICSSNPTAAVKPAIYPSADAARPMMVHGTDFVTISGFIFKNNQITKADAMTGINFEGHTPVDSQVTFDNCVWDGQGKVYNFKAILFCWQPHCNITVQNSTFQNIVVGTDLSVVYLGARARQMRNVPTFRFVQNQVINNSDPEVQIEGNSTQGYYHKIVIQDNEFSGNKGDWNLVVIRNQRAGCDIGWNEFYDNTFNVNDAARPTLAIENCASAYIHDNWLIQNDAEAEVFVQASAAGTTVLTGNIIAASKDLGFGVWADLSGKAMLQSYDNTFYSDSGTDSVAYWGPEGAGQPLTIDGWNAKTLTDGLDFWLALPAPQPPAQ